MDTRSALLFFSPMGSLMQERGPSDRFLRRAAWRGKDLFGKGANLPNDNFP